MAPLVARDLRGPLLWLAGGIWWWVRGPRTTWQRAVRGFAQGHVAAFLFIEVVSVSGVLGNALLSYGWFPGAAAVGGIGAFTSSDSRSARSWWCQDPGLRWHGHSWRALAAIRRVGGDGGDRAWTGILGLSALMLRA